MSDRIREVIITIVFCLFIVFMLIINIIKKDESISISERRKLQKFPEITFEKVFNGTASDEFDKYVTDQFIKRDEFRSIKLAFELNIMQNQDYNNIFKSGDYLAEQLFPLNEKSVTNLTSKINYIKDTYLTDNNNIYYMIIPDKGYYINDKHLKLDYEKMKSIMKQKLEFATYIDIFNCLDIDSYYKTDSHWRQEKLLNVVQKMSSIMNFNANNNYTQNTLTTFKGVYSGQFPLGNEEDSIVILTNDILDECLVYNYEKNTYSKVYDMTKINAYDKYDIYLSGATPLLKIQNPNYTNDKELIVFRDSYSSSLIPLLAGCYKTITLVDTRYISPRALSNYITFDNQDILFAYGTIVINNSYSLK